MEFSHPQHILKTFSIVHKIIRKHFDGPRCENQFRFVFLGKILGRLTGEILYPFQYRHLIKIMFWLSQNISRRFQISKRFWSGDVVHEKVCTKSPTLFCSDSKSDNFVPYDSQLQNSENSKIQTIVIEIDLFISKT